LVFLEEMSPFSYNLRPTLSTLHRPLDLGLSDKSTLEKKSHYRVLVRNEYQLPSGQALLPMSANSI
jgi:hypothetical protein